MVNWDVHVLITKMCLSTIYRNVCINITTNKRTNISCDLFKIYEIKSLKKFTSTLNTPECIYIYKYNTHTLLMLTNFNNLTVNSVDQLNFKLFFCTELCRLHVAWAGKVKQTPNNVMCTILRHIPQHYWLIKSWHFSLFHFNSRQHANMSKLNFNFSCIYMLNILDIWDWWTWGNANILSIHLWEENRHFESHLHVTWPFFFRRWVYLIFNTENNSKKKPRNT